MHVYINSSFHRCNHSQYYVDLNLRKQVTVDEIVLGHYICRIHLDLD